MITSLLSSLGRVTLFWYILGALVLFLGDPAWAERAYTRLSLYPWVPTLEMHGLGTAAEVQLNLVLYWTVPVMALWVASFFVGILVSEVSCRLALRQQTHTVMPKGRFWDVFVPAYSLGALPQSTTPPLRGQPVVFEGSTPATKPNNVTVSVQGAMREAVKMLTPAERQLCEELLQLLWADPEHFAGLGHGVGLLEHTLNVATEAAARCTPEFRMPLLAALAHDVGKLITFQSDGKGGWVRRGLHSRESARILATLPGFQALPEVHQRALLLAVKYDHAPNKMPVLRGERESTQLAMRVISALSMADRTATAAEKDRNLEKLKPEDLLWQDFVDFLRDAPVVQRGKKGAANQVNNPPDSPYLYIYEAPWRDAAVHRMPAEVAAALDLTRRDSGKLAKYTRILVERLRKEGLLVESYQELAVSESNPLWDIQSGTGEKAVVLRGILVLHADALWKLVNYRLSIKSPFPVQILAPNADATGRVQQAPEANRDVPNTPDISDGLKLADVSGTDVMSALGLTEEPLGSESAPVKPRPKTRARGQFKAAEVADEAKTFGLDAAPERVARGEPAQTELTLEQPEAPVQVPAEEQDAATASALELVAALGSPPADAVLPDVAESAEPGPLDESLDASPQDGTPPAAVAPAAPVVAEASPTAPELSRAERREGLAIADEAACATYPGLTLGDKYYTEQSRAVHDGLKKPGSKYKGDNKEKQLDLSSTGPRRGRRKLTN